MTRIVAGLARGRRLAVPHGQVTRPTSDRAREALFSTVDGLVRLEGARVLDLYAGSGALGLEALSRGAGHALFVEAEARVARTLRENINSVELAGATVLVSTAEKVARTEPAMIAGTQPPYDIVFADPPYRLAAEDLRAVLADLHSSRWLAEQAVLVIERAARDDAWVWPTPVQPIRDRRYGEAWLWYGRAP